MTRRRWIGMLVGLLVIVGAVAYVVRPTGHVPLFDANLVRLAESDLQGYCAGEAFWRSGGYGDATLAAACRSRLVKQRPDVPDVGAVPRAFCAAIVAEGWTDGDAATCVGILLDNRLWPTYDGSLSDQWNRARPYPARPISAGARADESRTGGRGDAPKREGTPSRRIEEGVG